MAVTFMWLYSSCSSMCPNSSQPNCQKKPFGSWAVSRSIGDCSRLGDSYSKVWRDTVPSPSQRQAGQAGWMVMASDSDQGSLTPSISAKTREVCAELFTKRPVAEPGLISANARNPLWFLIQHCFSSSFWVFCFGSDCYSKFCPIILLLSILRLLDSNTELGNLFASWNWTAKPAIRHSHNSHNESEAKTVVLRFAILQGLLCIVLICEDL